MGFGIAYSYPVSALYHDVTHLMDLAGYNNAFEGLSGGFVYGAGGTGFITPKRTSPAQSGANSPVRGGGNYGEGHLNGQFGV